MSPRAVGWLLAMLTACEGGRSTDIAPSLRFAAFSDASIGRFIEAASGIEGERARSLVHGFEHASGECPTIVVDSATATVHVTGDCARPMETLAGSAALTNVPWTGVANDLAEPATYAFTRFGTELPGFVVSYDGTLVLGPAFAYFDLDLTTQRDGLTVRSDLHLPCSDDRCTAREVRGGIDVVGAGGAHVTGAASDDTVQLELVGYDTVHVEIVNNCARWRIVATNRAFSSCEQ